MKPHLLLPSLLSIITLANLSYSQPPSQWPSRGVGGGGALYSPSINPGNDNEYYLSCDMSDLFHTTDFGLSYSIVDFRTMEGSINSAVHSPPDACYSCTLTRTSTNT